MTRFCVQARSKNFSFPPGLLFAVSALLSHQGAQPLHNYRAVVKRLSVIELNDKENAIRPPVASAGVTLSLTEHQSLVYRAEAARSDSVHSSYVKKN